MFDNITILLCDRDHHHDRVRIVPAIGPIVEQSGPVAKTPQYQGPPARMEYLIMAFEMKNSEFTTIRIMKFVDKKGQPAKVDGTPTWLTDNSEVLALEPASDGMTCKVSAVGVVSAASVTMTADADLGAGVKPFTGVFDVNVNAGDAVAVVLEADPPTEQL